MASIKTKTRKSPDEHAANTELYTIAVGSDNFLYICEERKNKTKYWKKTRVLDTPVPNIEGKYIIAIGELSSTIILNDMFSTYLNTTPEFLEILSRKPKYLDNGRHNAYLFGKYFDQYYQVGRHGNDYYQTGIINMTDFSKKDKKEKSKDVYYSAEITKIMDYKLWHNIYWPKKNTKYKWEERKLLPLVQSEISDKILFVGGTYHLNGVNIYAHLNTKNEIDSLIIDGGFFI
jgi:hypothetical protein